MATSTIIFVGSPEKIQKNRIQTIKHLFLINPNDIVFRIFASFMPPFGKNYRRVYVDFQGPLLALFLLIAFVNYGCSLKMTKCIGSPIEIILTYSIIMPILCYLLTKLVNSFITLSEIICLIGYGLYGHLLTLFVSFLCFQERSNFFFFVCLILFGGLSTFRIAIVFLKTIELPIARLLICALVAVVNILYIIFLHFAYMHRTFVY